MTDPQLILTQHHLMTSSTSISPIPSTSTSPPPPTSSSSSIPPVTLSDLDNNNSNATLLQMMEGITLDDKKDDDDDLFVTEARAARPPTQIHRNISLDHILGGNTTTTTNMNNKNNNNSDDELGVADVPRSISVPTDDEGENDGVGRGMDANIFKMVQKTPLMSAAHNATITPINNNNNNNNTNNNSNGLSIPFYNKVDNTLHTQSIPSITLSGKGFTTSGSKPSMPSMPSISTTSTIISAGGSPSPSSIAASPPSKSGTESPQNPPTLASLLSSPIGDSPQVSLSADLPNGSPFSGSASSPFSITAAPTTPPGTFTSLASAKSTVTFTATNIKHDIPPIQIPQQQQQQSSSSSSSQHQSKLFMRVGGTRTLQGRAQKTPQMQPLTLSQTPLQQPAQSPQQQPQQGQGGSGGGPQTSPGMMFEYPGKPGSEAAAAAAAAFGYLSPYMTSGANALYSPTTDAVFESPRFASPMNKYTSEYTHKLQIHSHKPQQPQSPHMYSFQRQHLAGKHFCSQQQLLQSPQQSQPQPQPQPQPILAQHKAQPDGGNSTTTTNSNNNNKHSKKQKKYPGLALTTGSWSPISQQMSPSYTFTQAQQRQFRLRDLSMQTPPFSAVPYQMPPTSPLVPPPQQLSPRIPGDEMVAGPGAMGIPNGNNGNSGNNIIGGSSQNISLNMSGGIPQNIGMNGGIGNIPQSVGTPSPPPPPLQPSQMPPGTASSGMAAGKSLESFLGSITALARDQSGSRFIQQELEGASEELVERVLDDLEGEEALDVMEDIFGNYVVQKLYDVGSARQIKRLNGMIGGSVMRLSLHTHGCRVVQKALECSESLGKLGIAQELRPFVLQCVRNQNGNHVIQRCVETMSPYGTQFIVDVFEKQTYSLAVHPYGCRVIQRILEHCPPQQNERIIREVLGCAPFLVKNQYGNYVIQHILEHGDPRNKSVIIAHLLGHVATLSTHKFASNVIEKCIQYGTYDERQAIVKELLGPRKDAAPLAEMAKDQFANYVVQKILDVVEQPLYSVIIMKLCPFLAHLSQFPYAKHIVARIEASIASARGQGEMPAGSINNGTNAAGIGINGSGIIGGAGVGLGQGPVGVMQGAAVVAAQGTSSGRKSSHSSRSSSSSSPSPMAPASPLPSLSASSSSSSSSISPALIVPSAMPSGPSLTISGPTLF